MSSASRSRGLSRSATGVMLHHEWSASPERSERKALRRPDRPGGPLRPLEACVPEQREIGAPGNGEDGAVEQVEEALVTPIEVVAEPRRDPLVGEVCAEVAPDPPREDGGPPDVSEHPRPRARGTAAA